MSQRENSESKAWWEKNNRTSILKKRTSINEQTSKKQEGPGRENRGSEGSSGLDQGGGVKGGGDFCAGGSGQKARLNSARVLSWFEEGGKSGTEKRSTKSSKN